MREILFRGKLIDNCIWAFGNLSVEEIDYSEVNFIKGNKKERTIYIQHQKAEFEEYCNEYGRRDFRRVQNRYKVDPDTVGQYTGLTDKNGKRIFEGDIVRGISFWHEKHKTYQVAFDDGDFYLVNDSGTMYRHEHVEDIEVIGNIHDNPELLEARQEI